MNCLGEKLFKALPGVIYYFKNGFQKWSYYTTCIETSECPNLFAFSTELNLSRFVESTPSLLINSTDIDSISRTDKPPENLHISQERPGLTYHHLLGVHSL